VPADALRNPEDASQWRAEDVISRGYKHYPNFLQLLENTSPTDELSIDDYDALIVASGQGPLP